MKIFSNLILLTILVLLAGTQSAVADYQDDLDAKDAAIADCQDVITHKQALIAGLQAGIDADNKSLEQTRNIYDIGLDKYKNMEAEVKGIEDTINNLTSNIFIMRSTYKDFYNAYVAYKDAWYDKNYERMNVEYLKMWRYSHGFEEYPPYQDPVTGFYEVRKWFIKMGARWSIRSLHSVVSSINLVRSFTGVKEKISDVISVANEGFKEVFDYASEQTIDMIKESAIENLKSAGSATSSTIEDTIAVADALADPLGAAEEELQRMVERIEKKESFGYPSKEEAIEKMTNLIVAAEELHEQAELDANEVLTELGPVKAQIKSYKDAIVEKQEAQQIYNGHIKEQRVEIIQLGNEKGMICYTYNSSRGDECTNYASGLSVFWNGGTTLSLNQATSSLTGYPIEVYSDSAQAYIYCKYYNACSNAKRCTDDPEACKQSGSFTTSSLFLTPIDSSILTATGNKLTFSSGKITSAGAGAGEETLTLTWPGKTRWLEYNEWKACGDFRDANVPTGSGPVQTIRDFTIIEASDFFLIPKDYKKDQKPIAESFPTTYFTFFKKTETPYKDEVFYLAYKLTGEEYYQYKQVDNLKVTVTDLETHPDGIITGKYTLDGYMKVEGNTDMIKLASLTIYAENITPTVSFTDYEEESVTITKGLVPLDRTIQASLVLSSGLIPEHGIHGLIKVKLIVDRFGPEKVYENASFVKDNIFFENFNYIGSPIPIKYEITAEREDGYVEQTIKAGDFGEDLIGSVMYDDFYMTETGKDTEYLSHKNEFYFEKANDGVNFAHDIHGTTLLDHDVIVNLDSRVEEILFDASYTIGIRNFPIYSSSIYKANVPIRLIGGQMTTERNKIYQGNNENVVEVDEENENVVEVDEEEDDLVKLNEYGMFLSSSNETGFVSGFNYNVVKLRMRESDGHRYFVLKILGPTQMDTHSVKWAFSDESAQTGSFVQNGMIWESIIEPDRNLKEVELFSRDMISQGKLEMADFVTEYPTLYGIYEDEFVIRLQERYENMSGSYQLKDKKLMFVQNNWTDSSVDISFPVDNPAMTLKKAAGVDMVPVEEISVTGNTVKFYLGMFPRQPLKVIQPPITGSLDIKQNRIIYSAPDGFSGTSSFRIDLYGALSNPYELTKDNPEWYMKAVESRYIDVKIDYSGASPVLWVTSVYKSPIEIALTLEFDAIVNSVGKVETGANITISSTNNQMVSYTPKRNIDVADDDVVTLNGNYIMNLTCYRNRLGSRMVNLSPGETYVLNKKYLQALYYHIFEGKIEKLQPSIDQWTPGFEYQMKKDDEDVAYVSGGYPLESFDTLEITYNPPADVSDPKPAGLQLTGWVSNDSHKAFIYFFSQDEIIQGDVDGNGKIDLVDLIMILKVMVGIDQPVSAENDVNNDNVIGIEEAIHVMQTMSEGE